MTHLRSVFASFKKICTRMSVSISPYVNSVTFGLHRRHSVSSFHTSFHTNYHASKKQLLRSTCNSLNQESPALSSSRNFPRAAFLKSAVKILLAAFVFSFGFVLVHSSSIDHASLFRPIIDNVPLFDLFRIASVLEVCTILSSPWLPANNQILDLLFTNLIAFKRKILIKHNAIDDIILSKPDNTNSVGDFQAVSSSPHILELSIPAIDSSSAYFREEAQHNYLLENSDLAWIFEQMTNYFHSQNQQIQRNCKKSLISIPTGHIFPKNMADDFSDAIISAMESLQFYEQQIHTTIPVSNIDERRALSENQLILLDKAVIILASIFSQAKNLGFDVLLDTPSYVQDDAQAENWIILLSYIGSHFADVFQDINVYIGFSMHQQGVLDFVLDQAKLAKRNLGIRFHWNKKNVLDELMAAGTSTATAIAQKAKGMDFEHSTKLPIYSPYKYDRDLESVLRRITDVVDLILELPLFLEYFDLKSCTQNAVLVEYSPGIGDLHAKLFALRNPSTSNVTFVSTLSISQDDCARVSRMSSELRNFSSRYLIKDEASVIWRLFLERIFSLL